MVKGKNWIFAFLLVTSAVSAQAAIVYLENGNEVKGTVVSATAQYIELYTDNGTMRISAERIWRIDYNDGGAPPAQSKPPMEPPTTAAPPPPEQLPRRYVRRVPYARPPPDMMNFEDLRHEFSFNFGIVSPLSDVDFSSVGGANGTNGGSGAHLGVQYLYYQNPRLGTGINFEYFNRSGRDDFGLVPNADTNIFGDTLLIMGSAKYLLTDRGPVQPYILGGLGINHTSEMIDATPVIGASWNDTDSFETRRLVDDSRWGWASTARIGVDFHMMEPSLFSLELGWIGLSNARYQATPAGQNLGLSSVTGNLSTLMFGARWGWRF